MFVVIRRSLGKDPATTIGELASPEVLGKTLSQKEAAKFVYDSWPKAVCAPYQGDNRKSKHFRKQANRPVVLLVWPSNDAMKQGDAPCAIVEEKLEGWKQELWMRNLTGEVQVGIWGKLRRLFAA